MSNLSSLLPLALAAAVWPTLLAVVLVALQAARPERLLAAFLAGGLLTTMTVGLVIIYALSGSSLVTTDQNTTDPTIDVVMGIVAIVIAWVMHRRDRSPAAGRPKKERKSDKRIKEVLDRGAVWAFVAGVALDLLPSPFALVALKDIAEANYDIARTVVTLLGFYLVVFIVIEVPLVGYLFSPERTADRTVRFNAWLARNWYALAVYTLAVGGVVLIVKGTYEFLT